MVDKYQKFSSSGFGQFLVKKLGLPNPIKLQRYDITKVLVDGSILFGAAPNSKLVSSIANSLSDAGAKVLTYDAKIITEATSAKIKIEKIMNEDQQTKFKALVFDASGIEKSEDLRELYNFFHPVARRIKECGRVLLFALNPENVKSTSQAIAQRAIVGFIKSIAKEFKKGITVQLIYVEPKATNNLDSTIKFFISPKSAYVSGQVINVKEAEVFKVSPYRPLLNTLSLVTGASRGIGEAIAKTMARDGAEVICLDVPQMEDDLKKVAKSVNGHYLCLDITSEDAGIKIEEFLQSIGKKTLNSIVHNAGITRDKTFANMKPELWDIVINVNLSSIERINGYLLDKKLISKNGRIVCVSSISGIGGNLGQSNYATSKAGVIGIVKFTAPKLTNGITINAVAPGFIETKMTAAIPLTIREAGRRMNSMSQGGLPIDVAETICWFASPASSGLNGNIVRVCGQSLLGA